MFTDEAHSGSWKGERVSPLFVDFPALFVVLETDIGHSV